MENHDAMFKGSLIIIQTYTNGKQKSFIIINCALNLKANKMKHTNEWKN